MPSWKEFRRSLAFRVKPYLTKKAVRPPQAGLPACLPQDVLQQFLAACLPGKEYKPSFEKLSSWKQSGAYRIVLQEAERPGSSLSCIYKDSDYRRESIPALKALPLRPGPPEVDIYQCMPAKLKPFLPALLWHQTVQSGIHFRFFFEDLQPHFRGVAYERDYYAAAATLPALHRALDAAFEQHPSSAWLQFDRGYSEALQISIRLHIPEIVELVTGQLNGASVAAEANRMLDRLGMHHFSGRDHLQPVHGDFNASNIHLAKRSGGGIKVVDWEWAGWGLPQDDLASLLKPTPPSVERKALQIYLDNSGKLPEKDFLRLYYWCKLERSLLDVTFLSIQLREAPATRGMNLRSHIQSAFKRASRAMEMLG